MKSIQQFHYEIYTYNNSIMKYTQQFHIEIYTIQYNEIQKSVIITSPYYRNKIIELFKESIDIANNTEI